MVFHIMQASAVQGCMLSKHLGALAHEKHGEVVLLFVVLSYVLHNGTESIDVIGVAERILTVSREVDSIYLV